MTWGVEERNAVALASGTGRVVKLDRQDGSLSLMGPFGGINNLDVLVTPEMILLKI